MQRRQFLGASVGLSSILCTSGIHSVANTTSEKIKLGQIGTKHAHASGQMRTLRALGDTYEVVGIVEPDQVRRERLQRDSTYADVPFVTEDQLLNTHGLQVVAVETEVKDLLATSQRCLDAGMHIHIDKPAGESWSAIQRIHETAEKKSLSIQMGYMFRYNPAFRFLFDAAKNGWLGDVFEIHGVMSKTVDDATRLELAEYAGGSMFELGCHLIDPLLHLMGNPKSVTGFMKQTQPEKDNLYDNTLAVFDFGKATGTIRSTVIEVDGDQRRQFIVCGNEGTIEILPLEPPTLRLTLSKARGKFKKGKQTVALDISAGRYHGAWIDFAKVIRGEKQHDFSREHDLAVQKAILVACGYSLES